MRYYNKRTGAIIDSPSIIYGGDWIEYDKDTMTISEENIEKEEPKVKENSSDLTKAEIINELEALGINHDKNDKKEDLLKLLMGE